uniref:NADH dehydrogenase subunit 4L n=1 Tax=Pediopsoides anchorides TaxID=3035251 RepID=UPI0024114487|nr:NADH dehydrogenase subunit 4L [Pediopsoides anchorides]WEP24780.1 NADH dehydrogenase subunit 4L [Pediopsoides anchorides]
MKFFFFFFFFGIFSLIYIRKHLLLCLLSLEFVVLSLLMLVFLNCLYFYFSFYVYVFFMSLYVCEGVLGLSILVNMIRFHGNDYLSSVYLW